MKPIIVWIIVVAAISAGMYFTKTTVQVKVRQPIVLTLTLGG